MPLINVNMVSHNVRFQNKMVFISFSFVVLPSCLWSHCKLVKTLLIMLFGLIMPNCFILDNIILNPFSQVENSNLSASWSCIKAVKCKSNLIILVIQSLTDSQETNPSNTKFYTFTLSVNFTLYICGLSKANTFATRLNSFCHCPLSLSIERKAKL